jgi:hypothetical protein
MNRRTFIHSAGAAGLGLTGRLGLAETGEPIPTLVKTLEDSPRERLPADLVRLIRAGLRYEDLLAALFLAATRNVQPYPDVGFKYHSVMMLRSVHATQEQIPTADRWLPLIWAVDYFKDTQAQEQAGSGWHMSPRAPSAQAHPEAAHRSLILALDRWDHDAADAAIVDYCRSAHPADIFPVLFSYGARDLREIGHKAITVANAHSLMPLFAAGADPEPVLRSTVAALLNSEGEPDPPSHDLAPDRPWRRNLERLPQIPTSWKQGHVDSSAVRGELRAALYRLTPEESGSAVVEMLQHGASPEAIWQVLFDTAAELLMHAPGIVPLHAQTTANALHYAYRVCDNEKTQQLTLLQCAAFVAMFREMTHTSENDVDLGRLEPLPPQRKGTDAVDEIFSDLSAGHRLRATRKSLGYLRGGGDAGKLIATARHHLVYGAQEAHDYKFTEAVFDSYAQFSDLAWRARFLSAGMAYFKAPTRQPVPIVEESSRLLQA